MRIIIGGRSKGKMMAIEKWLATLPEEQRKNIVVIKSSDPAPKLRGNKLPRIVDYDMMEISKPSWKLWEEIQSALKIK